MDSRWPIFSATISGLALAAALWWPRVGLLATLRQWLRLRQRVLLEDALKHLLDCEHADQKTTPESLAGALGLPRQKVPALVARMESNGLLSSAGGAVSLTPEGRRSALRIVRAHRLLESYFADEAGLPIERIHRAAHKAEHHVTAEELDALDAHLGYPQRDPHGDPIPSSTGALPHRETVPLTDWPADKPAVVVHIEDEPQASFAQIVAAGLLPGTIVRVLDADSQRLVVSDQQNEHCLAPIVAANIQVAEAPKKPDWLEGLIRLSELPDRTDAEVVAIDPNCRGFTRRRLLDFGITPTTPIRADLGTFFGDPRAFRVRGTLIALRREQAAHVWVRPVATDEATGKEDAA